MLKRNFFRLGLILGLVAVTFITLPATSPSVNAGTVLWSEVDTPGNLGNVIVSPSEINDLAIGIDGMTFYAVDTPNNKIYKSLDGGKTWNDLSSNLIGSGASLPAWNITVAPDNPSFVASITSSGGLPRNVFVSTDGGASWQNTGSPAADNIGDIVISPNYGSYDIAIGTRTGTGNGDVYVLNSSSPGEWISQGLTGDVVSLKFSPGYRADASLVTVSATGSGTYVNLGVHDTAANTTDWATWGPVEVTAGGAGTSPKVNQMITADLELPSDFSGQSPNLRRMYVSLEATANAGIFRLDDTVCHLLMPPPLARIASIAYYGSYGSGKLLAGAVLGDTSSAATTTWFTNEPVTCSATCWFQAQKAPTGGGNSGFANARVIWSPNGNHAYCATSSAVLSTAADWPGGYLIGSPLDESAFSLSQDNGETWNQLSLIDTEIDFLSDVAVTPESDIIYLSSINNHGGINSFDSIWKTTGAPTGNTWERVLCFLPAGDDIIMRTSNAGNDPAVYFASRSTGDLRQSLDGGQTWNNTLPEVNVTDFAATRIDNTPTLFILNDSYVRHGTTNGQTWQWSTNIDTTLSTGHTINATPTGVVVVGDGGDGMVAYSLDGGASFAKTVAIPESGKMQVIADYRFRNALPLYAASDSAASEIYYWIVGSSSYWSPMGSPGHGFYGLAQLGTLYGAWTNAGSTSVDRTLEPEKLEPPYIEWDTLGVGLTPGVVFTREPSSLNVSAGINLWAIDNRPYTATTGRLWNFYDPLSPSPQYTPPPPPSQEVLFQAPVAISPTEGQVIPIYLDTGEIGAVTFKWRHRTAAEEYELWLAKDEDFNQIVLKQEIKPDNVLSPAWRLPETVSLEKGGHYFWKIRVVQAETGETGKGQWSNIMSFSTASPPLEEVSGPQSTPTKPPSNAPEANGPSPRVAAIPPLIWIVIALLLVIVPISVFIISRSRR
jgi:photosystem II stability/assembly factor-like uncharacterized protein